MQLRDATPADHPALVALNTASVAVLSPMDDARLRALLREAAMCTVMADRGGVHAFLLAFREGRRYDSPNYRWFESRYPRFLYIDRVVVDAACRRAGLGRALYANVFARAVRDAVPVVTCEFDVEPPNPASARFHANHGFAEVGRQALPGGKVVSLQAAPVAPRG
jgi:predicted GNAT superfamily acetyltransferase